MRDSERPRSRVFISCGQQKKTDEVNIAAKIADELRRAGFEPYIAVAEQTLSGVKESIFRQLSESEYFIFIDFKREPLGDGVFRGSLYSHQELAIASFLNLDILAFQEDGVKSDDGLLRFLQMNCIGFSDRGNLPDVVANRVKVRVDEKRWNPNWRNELIIDRKEGHFEDAFNRDGSPSARYFHIEVANNHQSRIARDCTAYVEQLTDLSKGVAKSFELVELKWKGVKSDSVTVPPGTSRFIDAFHLFFADASKAWLGINRHIVDRESLFHEYAIQGPGVFDLQFVVLADGYAASRATFRLTLGNEISAVQLNRT